MTNIVHNKIIRALVITLFGLLCFISCKNRGESNDIKDFTCPEEYRSIRTLDDEKIEKCIDKITVCDYDGNIIYQCVTDSDVRINFEYNELTVRVPNINCNCFDE